MDSQQALKAAIAIAGGVSKVAKALGITSGAVSQWNRCPAERVPDLVRLCEGTISPEQLRPDVFGERAA